MSTFTDAPFMPAADKRRVLTQWRHFLQTLARHFNDKDRSFRAFSDALYRHLIQHCSFIAHYSRSGFFAHYFDRGDDAIRFLRQFDRVLSASVHEAAVGGGVDCRSILPEEDDRCSGTSQYERNRAWRRQSAASMRGGRATAGWDAYRMSCGEWRRRSPPCMVWRPPPPACWWTRPD